MCVCVCMAEGGVHPCRCLALYQIGMLAFSELRLSHPSRRLPEVIDILLASLQVGGTVI